MPQTNLRRLALSGGRRVALGPSRAGRAPKLAAVIDEQNAADREAKQVQERIDKSTTRRTSCCPVYRTLTAEAESFPPTARSSPQVQSQVDEIANTTGSWRDRDTTREVMR